MKDSQRQKNLLQKLELSVLAQMNVKVEIYLCDSII